MGGGRWGGERWRVGNGGWKMGEGVGDGGVGNGGVRESSDQWKRKNEGNEDER